MSRPVDTPLTRAHYADASKFMDTEAVEVPSAEPECCVYFVKDGKASLLRRHETRFNEAERIQFNRQTNAWAKGGITEVRRKRTAAPKYKRKAKRKVYKRKIKRKWKKK